MNRPFSYALPLVVNFPQAVMTTRWHHEILREAVFRRPHAILASFLMAIRNRVSVQAVLARKVALDVGALPLRRDMLEWLSSQHARGREIFLYNDTGLELAVPDEVNALVSGVISADAAQPPRESASSQLQNLFPAGFTYVGRTAGSSTIEELGTKVVLLGSRAELDSASRRLGKEVEAEFLDSGPTWRDWLRLLRPHHWTKNLLLFVPFLLEQSWRTPGVLLNGLLGFIALGIIASGTYILNDLADLQADRTHWSKRTRPLASGAIPLPLAALTAVTGIALGLLIAASLSTVFGWFILAYLVLTVGYSLRLKRIPLLDVAVIAALFALRLTMGISLSGARYSEWLLTFALMFFLSMALAKRHGEVLGAANVASHGLGHRGYAVSDAPLTLAIGTATAVASLVIMMIYLVEEGFPQGRYAVPEWLWVVPVVLSIWLGRIWLLVHREQMHDDPIAFALRDPPSLMLGAMAGLAFALAV
ncbi:MAG TPA: UbiA family prenyltransferase [Dongiaceae bacterium]|jgi:4-hydroxybenzoate polyprenyltransferase|nr:UbiA family prenyltransferase [Dongiaceae bacterium]